MLLLLERHLVPMNSLYSVPWLRQDLFCVLFFRVQKIKVSFASGFVPPSNVLLRRDASIFFPLLMKQVSICLASSIRALIIERKGTEKYERALGRR